MRVSRIQRQCCSKRAKSQAMSYLAQDMKLYLLNAASFGITMMDWLEPALKIMLLIITIGYTVHKWWIIKKDK